MNAGSYAAAHAATALDYDNHPDDQAIHPADDPEWSEVVRCPQCGRATFLETGGGRPDALVDYVLEADGTTTRQPHRQDCPITQVIARAGRYKADRDRLLAIIARGVAQNRPMAAWYELRRVARFWEAHE